jgi:predicted DsbA family dithiol-disulfide isomerase
MQVEVWADVICPWCGLGDHRLEAALERFPHRDEVQVIHHSFQLDPSAPPGSSAPVRDMLQTKGLDDGQIDAMTRRVEGLADSEGLRPYRVLDNRVGSTALAHELLAYAADQGHQAEAWNRLFRAYFGEARPIFSVEDLVSLAGEIGLDPEDTREALLSRRYADRVADEGREAAELGATGVPFFVIDRRYGVAGAQPVDTLLAALQRAWDERLAPDRS